MPVMFEVWEEVAEGTFPRLDSHWNKNTERLARIINKNYDDSTCYTQEELKVAAG